MLITGVCRLADVCQQGVKLALLCGQVRSRDGRPLTSYYAKWVKKDFSRWDKITKVLLGL